MRRSIVRIEPLLNEHGVFVVLGKDDGLANTVSTGHGLAARHKLFQHLVHRFDSLQTETWPRDVQESSIFPGRQSDNLGEDFFRLCPLSSRCRNAPHNLRLPVGRDRAVARKSS
jgi:hypothetical protein